MLGVVHDISEMEQAHERLRRSEARLREAESIAHLGSWEWDVTNRTQEWSDEVYRIYGESADAGLTPDEMLARHVPPEEMERMNAMLRGILRGEHIEPLVHHVVRADGETRVVTMHARVTERDGDRIIRVIGASQDITEQAAREAEVKRATALLAQANAMALLAPYEWNSSEQTWWWSDQLYEVVGYTRDQLPPTGESVTRFIHPDDRDQVIRSFMEASEARRGWDMEYRILRGDGEVRIVRDLAERITTEDGNALFRGSVQDITELTRLRERAMEAAAEVISIIDASLLPIIVIDEHGLVQRANAATERVFDWPVEELAGQDVSILAAGISLAEHGAYIDHYLRTGEASTREGLVIGRTREVRGRRRDGSEFPAQLTVAEAELGTGRRQFVGIVMDLTEQKATEEHLRQVQKSEALGTLVAGVAHDFNNLLTAIRGGVDMAREFPHEERWLDIATQASDRAAEVVRQLLRFSRRDEPRQVPMDAHELIREATLLSRETLDRRIWFTSHADSDLPTLTGDPGQMQQVLMNLIVNARDAVLERAETAADAYEPAIQLTARAQEVEGRAGVAFEVRDNGTGMTEDVRQRALDPFFTTKPADRGTGLGLPAVSGIIERHKGEVTIYTEPGEGTEVAIWLPVERHSEANVPDIEPSEARHELTAAQGRPTILVVDDEESLGAIASAYLEAAGYGVTYFQDGNDAIEAARTQSFSLAILDLNMPSPNGWEVMAALHEYDAGLPVLIASGFADEDEARERGAIDLLPKPYQRETLVGLVKQLVRVS